MGAGSCLFYVQCRIASGDTQWFVSHFKLQVQAPLAYLCITWIQNSVENNVDLVFWILDALRPLKFPILIIRNLSSYYHFERERVNCIIFRCQFQRRLIQIVTMGTNKAYEKFLPPWGFEPTTIRVTTQCDNHYPTSSFLLTA